MEFKEFMVVAATIRSAYPNVKVMETEESIEVWFTMLKDLDYRVLSEAVIKHIKLSRYVPSIADLRSMYRNEIVQDWSIDWNKLLNGARAYEITEGGQYALKTLTREFVDHCINGDASRIPQCLREFERLYNNYYAQNIKNQLIGSGIFEKVIASDDSMKLN